MDHHKQPAEFIIKLRVWRSVRQLPQRSDFDGCSTTTICADAAMLQWLYDGTHRVVLAAVDDHHLPVAVRRADLQLATLHTDQ